MKKLNGFFIALFIVLFSLTSCEELDTPNPDNPTSVYTNQHFSQRMLLVLSAPSINNSYYEDDFDAILDFMVDYANVVMGNDNIIVLADAATMPYLENRLPADVLLQANVQDIWMRDFTTVIPSHMLQFTYAPQTLSPNLAAAIQWSFINFTDAHNLDYAYTDFVLDGGNVVDNNFDKMVLTERFLEDNNLTVGQAKNILRNIPNIEEVSIIPYDDEILGHADGMVMFADDNTLLINRYEEPFRTQVLSVLQNYLPNVEIIEVDVAFDETIWDDYASACGINLNSTVTHNFIYTPTFNNAIDAETVATIQANTTKTVKTVNAEGVCFMGGSVRCLTWQLQGANAQRLITAARNN